MLANVRYRGLAVAEGARIVRTDDDALGPFIELDPPFPVGTALAVELVREGKVESRAVKVRRVHEGLPAGIFIQFTDGVALPTDLPSRPEAALANPAEPVAAVATPPAAVTATPIVEVTATPILEAAPEVSAQAQEPPRRRRKTTPPPTTSNAGANDEDSDTPADERRARPTEPVPIYAQQSFPDVNPRDTVPSMPAYTDLPPERMSRDTIETPIVSMEAEAEDETAGKPTTSSSSSTATTPTNDSDRRGGRKRKRSKTVIGH